MKKLELEDALNNHPNFSADRLYQLCGGKRLTNAIMWKYLCELHCWVPLEVVQSSHPDWVLVASSSEIGLWHRTSVVHQACDCLFSEHRDTPCCHLSAAMAHEGDRWIEYAQHQGLEVRCCEGMYEVSDRITHRLMGTIAFDKKWVLTEIRDPRPLEFDGVHEAIEYLAAVASFDWQLA